MRASRTVVPLLLLTLATSARAGGLEALDPATAFDHVAGTSGVVFVDLYAPC